VHLIEKTAQLGGQARNLFQSWRGEVIRPFLDELALAVQSHPRITVHLSTNIVHVEGFVGNFKTNLQNGTDRQVVEHGIAVIATGGKELKPSEYNYGQDPRIITHFELDRLLMENDPKLKGLASAVFIQCVGSREPDRPYCSRVCCTHSLKSALELKRANPEMNVYILYRDLRSFGEREALYLQARHSGVVFIRFSYEEKPEIQIGQVLQITVMDQDLRYQVTLNPDLITLATAVQPNETESLGQFFKVPVNEDGFFIEAHAKLRPVDFATDGVFLCGLAHYPKPIDESIAQAQAAAARAATILAKSSIRFAGTVAYTNQLDCSACGTCVSLCPYSAPGWNEKSQRAEINPVLCKGCGLCAASCRSGAIKLRGFDDAQIFSMIESV
jgi:heterodisulfide reductase subunit A2